ncbi:MAG: glutaredoxin family protein [Arenicellales bacterium]|jgi:thiol-disulfide isomerase/thioredoxin|nr:glutaredoxin family protein [Gammaproteobacteria bacterium]
MRIKLTLYSRRGCHLCEDMLSQLNELRSEYAFSLEVRDVDSDPIWVEQFGEAVPILLVGQVEICRYFLDQKALLSHLDIN